jgi:hypothetical protein
LLVAANCWSLQNYRSITNCQLDFNFAILQKKITLTAELYYRHSHIASASSLLLLESWFSWTGGDMCNPG